MRKALFLAIALVTVLVLASCVTEADPTGLRGVWKGEADGFDYIFTFTADGCYAIEIYNEGEYGAVDFGHFEVAEDMIVTDGGEYQFTRDGSKVIIDYWGTEIVLSRSSSFAKNNTSAVKLRGVWEGAGGLTAFASNGTFVTLGYAALLTDYGVEDGMLVIDGNSNAYMIINSKLYIQDDYDVFNGAYVQMFTRKTDTGTDYTAKNYLPTYSPWHLVDMSYGSNHYIYRFNTDGTYTEEYYYQDETDRSYSNGTYTYANHVIELSDNGDLAFAIIDQSAFMFSI